MEKKLKVKCLIFCILITIGIVCIYLSLSLQGISEEQKGYFSGLGTSLTILSTMILIKYVIALNNPKMLRKVEIEMTDERFKNIQTKSMAITFKICTIIEAFASIMFMLFNNQLCIFLGFLIMVQLIIYIITNVIISKKI